MKSQMSWCAQGAAVDQEDSPQVLPVAFLDHPQVALEVMAAVYLGDPDRTVIQAIY